MHPGLNYQPTHTYTHTHIRSGWFTCCLLPVSMQAEELFLWIPRKMLMTVESAKKSVLGKELVSEVERFSGVNS